MVSKGEEKIEESEEINPFRERNARHRNEKKKRGIITGGKDTATHTSRIETEREAMEKFGGNGADKLK